MFHDMEVKMRNTTAISRPGGWPWNVDTKNTRAAGKNPRIGTLWRMSSRGSITTAGRLLRAMGAPDATGGGGAPRALLRASRDRDRERDPDGDDNQRDPPDPLPGRRHRDGATGGGLFTGSQGQVGGCDADHAAFMSRARI